MLAGVYVGPYLNRYCPVVVSSAPTAVSAHRRSTTVENDSCYTQLPALLLFHCAMYNNIMLTFHQGVGCSLRLCRPPTVLQCPTKTHTTKSPSLRYISACTLQVMCYFNVYCVCMCANETCFIVNFLGRQKPPTE